MAAAAPWSEVVEKKEEFLAAAEGDMGAVEEGEGVEEVAAVAAAAAAAAAGGVEEEEPMEEREVGAVTVEGAGMMTSRNAVRRKIFSACDWNSHVSCISTLSLPPPLPPMCVCALDCPLPPPPPPPPSLRALHMVGEIV